MMNPPFPNLAVFQEHHRWVAEDTCRSISRSNRYRGWDFGQFWADACKLNAANPGVRSSLAANLVSEFEAVVDELPRPALFVTIVSSDYIEGGRHFLTQGLVEMRCRMHGLLGWFDALGVIEPAYYPQPANWLLGKYHPSSPIIHWHAHALVFGSHIDEMEKILNFALRDVTGITKDFRPFHVRTLNSKWPFPELFYVLKLPRKAYRVRRFGQQVPYETGSDTPVQPPKPPRHNKRDLRPGEMLLLLEKLAKWRISDLAFASKGLEPVLVRALAATRVRMGQQAACLLTDERQYVAEFNRLEYELMLKNPLQLMR